MSDFDDFDFSEFEYNDEELEQFSDYSDDFSDYSDNFSYDGDSGYNVTPVINPVIPVNPVYPVNPVPVNPVPVNPVPPVINPPVNPVNPVTPQVNPRPFHANLSPIDSDSESEDESDEVIEASGDTVRNFRNLDPNQTATLNVVMELFDGSPGPDDVAQDLFNNSSDEILHHDNLDPVRRIFKEFDQNTVTILKAVQTTIHTHNVDRSLILLQPQVELRGVMELRDSYRRCRLHGANPSLLSRDLLMRNHPVVDCGLTHIQPIETHSFDQEHAKMVSNIDTSVGRIFQHHRILWNVPCVGKLRWWHVSAVMLQLQTHNVDAVFLFEDVYWRISGQRAYPDFSVESLISKVAINMKRIMTPETASNDVLKNWLNSFFAGWIQVDYKEYNNSVSVQLREIEEGEFKKLGSSMALRTASEAIQVCYKILQGYPPGGKPIRELFARHFFTGLAVTLATETALAFGIPLVRPNPNPDPNNPDLNNPYVDDIRQSIEHMSIRLMKLYDDILDSDDDAETKQEHVEDFNILLNLFTTRPHGNADVAVRLAFADYDQVSTFNELVNFIEARGFNERCTTIKDTIDTIREVQVREGGPIHVPAQDNEKVRRHVSFVYETKVKPLVRALFVNTSNTVFDDKAVMWAKISAFSAHHYTTGPIATSLLPGGRESFLGASRCLDQGIPLMLNPSNVSSHPLAGEETSNLDDITVSITSQIRGLNYRDFSSRQLERFLRKEGSRNMFHNVHSRTNMWMLRLQDDPQSPAGHYARTPDGRWSSLRRSNPGIPVTPVRQPQF